MPEQWTVSLSYGAPSLWWTFIPGQLTVGTSELEYDDDTIVGFGRQYSDGESAFIMEGMRMAFRGDTFYRVPFGSSLERVDFPSLVPQGPSRDQSIVLDTIERHLTLCLSGRNPAQLLMLVRGIAGTGKTTLIEYISQSFAEHDATHMLAKLAPTGSAAGIIEGEFWHSGWLTADDASSPHFLRTRYILLDQFSRVSKSDLAALSAVLGRGPNAVVDMPFGGCNIILFGDLLQAPPWSLDDALYVPSHLSTAAEQGAALFDRFNCVFTLERQLYHNDLDWIAFLDRVRLATCTPADVSLLQDRILRSDNAAEIPSEWEDPTLMTTKANFSYVWNCTALRSFCASTSTRLYISPASDNCTGLNSEQKRELLRASRDDTGGFAGYVELAVGMRAFATIGTATFFGTVTAISLDNREPPWLSDQTIRVLHFPATAVYFTPNDGGSPSALPTAAVLFSWQNENDSRVDVIRHQFPVYPAYAIDGPKVGSYCFNDAIIDLATPEGQDVTAHEIHAMLSKVQNWTQLRILRPFDAAAITNGLDGELLVAEHRLQSITGRSSAFTNDPTP